MDIGYGAGRKRRRTDGNPLWDKKERDLDSIIQLKNKEIENLKHQVSEKHHKIGSQDKEIDTLKKRIIQLEEEVRNLKKELTETTKKLAEVEESVSQLQGNHDILVIGEVCRNFQAYVYQVVFPETKISPFYSYKMAELDKKIEKTKEINKKVEARKRWEDFKQKEHPERFQGLITALQKLRNTKVHQEISDKMDIENVLKAAEELNQQGDFGFLELDDFNFEDVKEFIRMWDRTERYVKDLKK